ncbi:murein L,D-transpeptidase [Salmonella enterica]|nr:murein L,D-transpeptidase [Salmonella enterica subsp. enterica serovar Typhimurium var. 5-]ELJ7746873.1 murein L,D-transpeptidase [Salmonella enterica]
MGRKGLLAIVLLSLFIAFILKFFWLTPYDEDVYLPVEKPVASSLKIIHPGDQLFIRILKAEDKLELWASANNKPYKLYKTWTICAWSGGLGPKHKQGDGKSPEGFYATNKGLLNPNSRYHLAFNIGYPNAYDRANGYTGDFIMVHGNCVSAGCYAMTDAGIEEIYQLVAQALNSGQKSVSVHIFPFTMNDENMRQAQAWPEYNFWRMLKPGYDYFEKNRRLPTITVENRRYKISPTTLP